MQITKEGAEEFQGVVNIENVLRPLARRTSRMDEQLLDDEARWIRHEQIHVGRDRYFSLRSDSHTPRRNEQQLKVPRLLRRDTGLRYGRVRLPAAFDSAPVERRQEFGVEGVVLLAEAIVRRGR